MSYVPPFSSTSNEIHEKADMLTAYGTVKGKILYIRLIFAVFNMILHLYTVTVPAVTLEN